MPLDPATMQRVKANYTRYDDERQEVLVDAMCALYRDIVGRLPSKELEEALREAIRYND